MSTKGVLVTLYSTVLLTGLALCALLVAVPMLLRQMEVLSMEWEHDFEGVKVKLNFIPKLHSIFFKKISNEMWSDLQSMGADIRMPRDRLRRQYEEFSGSENSNSYSSDNSYNYPSQAIAPTFGYGYAKLKCRPLFLLL